MKQTIVVVLCTLALSVDVAAAPPPLRPGLWEVTLQTRQPLVADPMTATQCITPERANPAPPVIPAGADCKVANAATDNDSLTYTIQCAKAHVTNNTKITYTGSTYSGTMSLQTENGTVVQTIDAKWLGPCSQQ
jgi:Protein of unknown function (DUF3617)